MRALVMLMNSKEPSHKVWREHYGEDVPDGCEIHHKDHNHDNNAIDNLACMTYEDHRAYHRNCVKHHHGPKLKCAMCGRLFIRKTKRSLICNKCLNEITYSAKKKRKYDLIKQKLASGDTS